MSPRSKLTLLLALPLLGFLVLLVVLWRGLGNDPSELPSALIDRPIPQFTLASVEDPGRQYSAADLKSGEIALINIWATWCAPCRIEHQKLVDLAAEGMPIYGINYKDDRQDAVQWLSDLGNPYKLTLTDDQGQLGLDLGVYGVPETFLLDADGVIRYRHPGVLDDRVWQDYFIPRIKVLQEERG